MQGTITDDGAARGTRGREIRRSREIAALYAIRKSAQLVRCRLNDLLILVVAPIATALSGHYTEKKSVNRIQEPFALRYRGEATRQGRSGAHHCRE
jgi:hypothetical protein